MKRKSFGWVAGVLLTMLVAAMVGALLVGFDANSSSQPQRVSDLVARIEELEAENDAQQALLNEFGTRLDALETSTGSAGSIVLEDDIVIPRDWVQNDSSDGIVRYWRDPEWELSGDEPGALDLWVDVDTAVFFTWDWGYDLLDDLHDDEEFFRFFEEDLLRSDDTLQMDVVNSAPLVFMGGDAHYWEIRTESRDGYSSRMLTIFYPCSDRTSCNMLLVRFDDDPEDDVPVPAFSRADWAFINTFAHGVEFLSEGKASVTANANLRACPATSCEIVGRLVRGEIVEVVAVSEDGLWLQLQSGEWVAASLVFGAPLDLPTVRDEDDI